MDAIINNFLDRSVHPNEFKTFYWTVPKNMGPAYQDPPCLTYIYKSDVDLSDVSSGLIGPLLVCRHGELQSEGLQVQSWYKTSILI